LLTPVELSGFVDVVSDLIGIVLVSSSAALMVPKIDTTANCKMKIMNYTGKYSLPYFNHTPNTANLCKHITYYLQKITQSF